MSLNPEIQEAFIQALKKFLYIQPEKNKEPLQQQNKEIQQIKPYQKQKKGQIQMDESIEVKLEEPSYHFDQSYTFETSERQSISRDPAQTPDQQTKQKKAIKTGSKKLTKEKVRIDQLINDLEITYSEDDGKFQKNLLEKPFGCDYCPNRYKTYKSRQQHYRSKHNTGF